MRKLLLLAFASSLVISGCGKKEILSAAPPCASVDDLLLKIDGIDEGSSLQTGFVSVLQALPTSVQEQVVSRIKAKIAADGQRIGTKDNNAREWTAVLLLSTKSETRATPDYRYCAGEFALGNGQSWRWQYSLADGNQGPVLRIINAEVVNSGVSAPAPTPLADPAPKIEPDAVTAEIGAEDDVQDAVDPGAIRNPASDVDDQANEAADGIADIVTARAAAEDDNLLQAQREVAQARAEAERERRQLREERARLVEQQRALADKKENEERQAYMRDAAERQRQQQEQLLASQGPTADELYESRRGECPGGFLGSDCRRKIRMEVCEGRWSSNPPSGYQKCKR